jgi:hypothetical protein
MNYTKLNNIAGWAVFGISFLVYALTVAPTASFWDCGEFIACANELQVPHPPGAPLYLMLGRVFALFGGPESAAFLVNLLSVFASAFTALFTFWTITMLGKRIVAPTVAEPEKPVQYALMFAGLVGGLCCTFADSIWFNAVEAEVYALSSFFTAIVFWLIFKWETRADEPNSNRWLLLIAYMMGLSIGVHLLNLLTIPALVLVYYFRKYKFSWVGAAAAMGISVVILAVVQYGIGQWTFDIAWQFEQWFTGVVDINENIIGADGRSEVPNPNFGKVTGMGMASGTGSTLWFILLFAGLAAAIWYSHKKRMVGLNTGLLGVLMVYIGLSSYVMVMVRSNANPSINENAPSNMQAFLSYMKREQYGDRPLGYGPMYNAQAIAYVPGEGKRLYYTFDEPQSLAQWGPQGRKLAAAGVTDDQVNSRYILYDSRRDLQYAPGGERVFPRMHSAAHYANVGPGSYHNYVTNKGADPSINSPQDDQPSGGDNFRFFLMHQVGHMYLRYFGWNFIARASDQQDALVFYRESVPLSDRLAHEPSHNNYFALPLIFGLLGMFWQFYRQNRDASVMMFFFLFTGLAIVVYLNQTPMQPRERDYSYAGSFQAYAIWVGLGVLALWELLNQYLKNARSVNTYIAGGLATLAVPVNMGLQNWDDHTRAGNYVCPDSARNLLESCAKDGILFTNGDNDTFPLWYLQEVEGVRTDVRVVNLSLLNTHWYIHELRRPQNDAPPVPLTVNEYFYMGEKNNVKFFQGQQRRQVTLPVDRASVIAAGIATEQDSILPEVVWDVPLRGGGSQRYLQKQDLMILDILTNVAQQGWKRPVYFAITIPPDSYLNLQPYFRQEGMAYRVVPLRMQSVPGSRGTSIGKEIMYTNLMQKFWFRGCEPGSRVFMDSNIRRMMGNFRNNFILLATAYLSDGEAAHEAGDAAAATAAFTRVDELITAMEAKIGDDVSPAESYVFAQIGQLYATMARCGHPNAKAKAAEYLERSLARAREDIDYNFAVFGTPTDMGAAEGYTYQIAYMAYSRELNDIPAARKVAEEIQTRFGDSRFLRTLEMEQQARPQPTPRDTNVEAAQDRVNQMGQ